MNNGLRKGLALAAVAAMITLVAPSIAEAKHGNRGCNNRNGWYSNGNGNRFRGSKQNRRFRGWQGNKRCFGRSQNLSRNLNLRQTPGWQRQYLLNNNGYFPYW